jgi:integrase/recombinase XerC
MLNDLLTEFLQHLQYERNVSPHTLRNYTSDLEQFRDYLLKIEKRDDVPVEQIDRLTIREWMAGLHAAEKKEILDRTQACQSTYLFSVSCSRRKAGI